MPSIDNDIPAASIGGSAPSPPSPEQDFHDGEDENNKSEAASGWKTILDYGTAQDDKMLEEWKDELANLLTFTGLFSAVVTGCIVLTLPMLQDDPASQSVVLLAQISQQLSSLSVGPQFLNSTIQPSVNATASTLPDPRLVKLNILWTLSLTISVMAAFFTITVQQWIRRIPLPPHLSVREAVRLWRLRQQGIAVWKVPAIISLLPVFVQVSVVFFLVGLYFYLETLHRPTALVLLIFGSVLLGLFLISALLPLLFRTCPYKSPVVPAAITVVQLGAFPILGAIWFLFMFIGNFVILGVQGAVALGIEVVGAIQLYIKQIATLIAGCTTDSNATTRETVQHKSTPQMHLRLRIAAFSFELTEWFTRMGISAVCYIVASETLWDRLELHYVSQHPERLDCAALAVTCARKSQVWRDQPDILYSCLRDIPIAWRASVGTSALSRTLISRHRDVSMIYPMPSGPVFFHASQHLPQVLSELEGVVWQSLPTKWPDSEAAEQRTYFESRAASLMCLLYRNNVLGTNPAKPPTVSSISRLARTLITIRSTQTAADVIKKPKQRAPTTLFFGCCFRGYTLSEAETQQSISWVLDVLRNLQPRQESAVRVLQREAYSMPLCDVVLGSVATTLLGCTSDSVLEAGMLIQHDELTELLEGCAGFLTEYAEDISIVTSVIAHVPPDRHIIVTVHALASIANSVARLAVQGLVAKASDCPSHEVVNSLRSICADAYGDELRDTERFLDVFDKHVARDLGSGSWSDGPSLPPEQLLLSNRPQGGS